jgi:hypothetical protein
MPLRQLEAGIALRWRYERVKQLVYANHKAYESLEKDKEDVST